ncbi:DUF2786 domain-containing protein [Vibrio fluvialis]|nr:DUF2786 domain-containing protein [Vibrio fluvialis]
MIDDKEKNRALERIKKCLALGDSGNEHEAALALQKAQALMKKYGITAENVSFSNMAKKSCETKIAKRPATFLVSLCVAVADAFGVRVVVHTGEDRRCVPVFYGAKECVVVAAYCFDVCSRQLNIARKQYMKTIHKNCKPTTRTTRADLFCTGWVASVTANLPALEMDSEATTLLSEYVDRSAGELSSVSTRSNRHPQKADLDAYLRGAEQGREFEVRRGVSGRSEQHLLY